MNRLWNVFCLSAAVVLSTAVTVGASPPGLSVSQEQETAEEGKEQVYHLSAPGTTDKEASSVSMEIRIPDSVTAEKVTASGFGAYTGEAAVTADGTSVTGTDGTYGVDGASVVIIALSGEIPEGSCMNDVAVYGTMSGEEAELTADYEVVYTDGTTESESVSIKTEAEKKEEKVTVPTLTSSSDSVDYISGFRLASEGLKAAAGYETVDVAYEFPENIFMDTVELPLFGDLDYTLLADGTELKTEGKTSVFVNSRVSELVFHINAKGEEVNQTSPANISVRNTVNEDSTQTMSVKVKAVAAGGEEEEFAPSTVSVTFNHVPDTDKKDDSGSAGETTDPSTDPGTDPSTDPVTDPSIEPGTGEETGEDAKSDEDVKKEDDPVKEDPATDTKEEEKPSGNTAETTGSKTYTSTTEKTVKDLTGYDIGNSKATSASTNTASQSTTISNITQSTGTSSGSSYTSSATPDSRLQTDDYYVYQVDSSTGETHQVNASDSTKTASAEEDERTKAITDRVVEEDEAPAEEIQKTTAEKASKAVKTNRTLQLFLTLLALLFIAAAVIFYYQKKIEKARKEKSRKKNTDIAE